MSGESGKPSGNGRRCSECGAAAPGEDGLCKGCRLEQEYGPEARRRHYQELGRRGAERSHGGRGTLRSRDLPPLETHEDAKRWARMLAEGVATGAIDKDVAAETRRQLKEWRAAHEAEAINEWKEEVEAALERLRDRLRVQEQPWE